MPKSIGRALLARAAMLGAILLGACREESPTETFHPSKIQENQGWVLVNGQPTQIAYTVSGGEAVFGGDVLIGPVDHIASTRQALESAVRNKDARFTVVSNSSSTLWANGVVPYQISNSLSSTIRDSVLSAMALVTAKTGISYVPKQSYHTSYLNVRPFDSDQDHPEAAGLTTQAGFSTTQENFIKLRTAGRMAIVHELLHSLGAFHEHQRCDRDSYVTVYTDSLASGASPQYSKVCATGVDYGTYDYMSLMHYSEYGLGIIYSGPPPRQALVMTTANSYYQHLIGRQDSMTTKDAIGVIFRYPPPAPTGVTITYNGSGNPVLSGTFPLTYLAPQYKVTLVKEYTYADDYSQTYYGYDVTSTDLVTSGSSPVTVSSKAHTGINECIISQSVNVTEKYTYWFEFYAVYNGLDGRRVRLAADVITC